MFTASGVETPDSAAGDCQKKLLRKSGIYHRDLSDFNCPGEIPGQIGGAVNEYELFFEVDPVPKGRPRFTRTGHAYTPKKTAQYEKQIRAIYDLHRGAFFEGPISIKLVFNMPIPKSTTKKMKRQIEDGLIQYTKKPDLDNLAKAVLDALNGIAFADDSQIVKLNMEKRYGCCPGVWLQIKEVCN